MKPVERGCGQNTTVITHTYIAKLDVEYNINSFMHLVSAHHYNIT